MPIAAATPTPVTALALRPDTEFAKTRTPLRRAHAVSSTIPRTAGSIVATIGSPSIAMSTRPISPSPAGCIGTVTESAPLDAGVCDISHSARRCSAGVTGELGMAAIDRQLPLRS